MGFGKKEQLSEGGYIFLSHAHADIKKVRELRNGLEQHGFEPLCFYLKCLNDDSEIEDLIKREIDAREWFVFANSENARKSTWVTLEREYIKRTNKKKIIEVDINNKNAVHDAIQKISRNLRIFISYSHKDIKMVRRIKKRLEKRDYLVFDEKNMIPPAENLSDAVTSMLSEAVKQGTVLALITENAAKSAWVQSEILYAVNAGGNVIPVIIGNVKLDSTWMLALESQQQYHVSANPTNAEIDEIIDAIGNHLMNKM